MNKKCSALTVKVDAAHNATPSVETHVTALATVVKQATERIKYKNIVY